MTLARTFYLFAPAFIANATPVVLLAIPFLKRNNAPVWASKLGHHKTWVGFIGGTAASVLVSALQYALRETPGFVSITFLHDSLWLSIVIGFLLGFGALAGDSAKSYIKRKIGIRPGDALPFWDGVDHIIGSLILLSPLYIPPLFDIVALLLVSPLLSLLANMFSYSLGWKRVWY